MDGDVLPFCSDSAERIRGDQYLPPKEPVSCLGDQIAYRPVLVIEVEFFDLAYFTVEALQFETAQGFSVYKHGFYAFLHGLLCSLLPRAIYSARAILCGCLTRFEGTVD
jgi:hypothetical protein